MAEIYKGYSTVNKNQPPFLLTDIDLVKQDILNAFNTRKGERVMLPNFGSRIHDLMMEPFDAVTEKAIIDDATNIIAQEPRVQLINVQIKSLDNAVRIDLQLNFQPQDVVEELFIEFKNLEDSQV